MSRPLPLEGKRFVILTGPEYEDLELHYPRLRIVEAGGEVIIAGPDAQEVYKGKNGYNQVAELGVADIRIEDLDALIIPGGWMPDHLRSDTRVLQLIRKVAEARIPIASICHGPQLDISAGIVKGVRYTGYQSIKDDLVNAGALWRDREVVVDLEHKRISSRTPDDLPYFCRTLMAMVLGTLKMRKSEPGDDATNPAALDHE
jgi:protease I